jgi:hypothetical protein
VRVRFRGQKGCEGNGDKMSGNAENACSVHFVRARGDAAFDSCAKRRERRNPRSGVARRGQTRTGSAPAKCYGSVKNGFDSAILTKDTKDEGKKKRLGRRQTLTCGAKRQACTLSQRPRHNTKVGIQRQCLSSEDALEEASYPVSASRMKTTGARFLINMEYFEVCV